MSYQPQPGTIVYRAIEWLKLQPVGTEVTASMWAEAIEIDPNSLIPCMAPAVVAGLVRKAAKPNTQRPFWFSLGDGKPLQRAQHEDDEPDLLPHRTKAPDVKPRPGELLPGIRGDEPVPASGTVEAFAEGMIQERQRGGPAMTLRECAAAEERPAAPRVFDAWLSGVSGELMLQGVHVDEDGDVTLTGEQAQIVRQVLRGAPE